MENNLTPILVLPKPASSLTADARGFRFRASSMGETNSAFKSESTAVSTCLTTESNESWHSDSEANWTLPGGSVRHYSKDLGVSLTPSELADKSCSREGDRPSSSREGDRLGVSMGGRRDHNLQKRVSVSFMDSPSSDLRDQIKDNPSLPTTVEQDKGEAKVEDAKTSKSLAAVTAVSSLEETSAKTISSNASFLPTPTEVTHSYGFELSRPMEIFGECSWNVLPLAVRCNLVPPIEEQSEWLVVVGVANNRS